MQALPCCRDLNAATSALVEEIWLCNFKQTSLAEALRSNSDMMTANVEEMQAAFKVNRLSR
jgi:hypothetical protein